jgi:hypothetical protein
MGTGQAATNAWSLCPLISEPVECDQMDRRGLKFKAGMTA